MENKIETIKWVIMKGCPNYEISEYGDIRNIHTKRILKQYEHINANNNLSIRSTIRCNGKSYVIIIANEVASNFLPLSFKLRNPDGMPIHGKIHVNHKDGDKRNNHYSNLEWCDLLYLVKNHRKSTRKSRLYRCIETGEIMTNKDAQRKYSIGPNQLPNCISPNNTRKTAGGYHWELI